MDNSLVKIVEVILLITIITIIAIISEQRNFFENKTEHINKMII